MMATIPVKRVTWPFPTQNGKPTKPEKVNIPVEDAPL